MSPIKNVALVNELGQVINHVVVDTDDTETMEALHAEWTTHRHVETTDEDVIILDESPEIWTTHCDDPNCEKNGFNLPDGYVTEPTLTVIPSPVDHETVSINGKVYPTDSLLIKENASLRPAGWSLPEGVGEVTLADKD